MTKIKICGLHGKDDILFVNKYKPDYIGFILEFPKSHRNISLEQLKEWSNHIDISIVKVGVFVNQSLEKIDSYAPFIDIIQLHGDEDEEFIRTVKIAFPTKQVWKAFKMVRQEDYDQAVLSCADEIILDNGYGTGKCFDWNLMKKGQRRFILAGGIRLENIQEAIEQYTPYAVDISSGVEVNGEKVEEKIRQMIEITQQVSKGVGDE